MSREFKIKQVILEQIYFNLEVKRFLDNLKTQHDRDIAGKTIDFIKTTYPEFASTLNGELVLEETTED
jgi:hypothetical protein